MPDYLIDGKDEILLTTSPYPSCWSLANTSFLILRNAVQLQEAGSKRNNHILSNKETGIASAFKTYQQRKLVLYRGIASCHFSWPGLLGGLLSSEGFADTPTFTMGNVGDAKTRWLPTAQTDEEARSIGIQDIDPYTRALSLSEPIFVGMSVAIPIDSPDLRVCWYNSGELGVRGPLAKTQYSISSMVWLDGQIPQFMQWPNAIGNTKLPQQRPYKPANERLINAWWAKSQEWADSIGVYNPEIKKRREESMLLVDIYD
jgi:hypothetical protein